MTGTMTMTSDKRRERRFIAASCAALLIALVGGVIMLLRARSVWNEEEQARANTALLARRDELRGAVAEITAERRLVALSADHTTIADLRHALQTTARAFQDDPLGGTDQAGAFACIAIELSSTTEGITVWTSGPMAAADRTWCLTAIAESGGSRGAQRDTNAVRILGVSWSAFRVDGRPHVGALAWITPRSH